MIQVTPHLRIFVAREPLDFRTRIDGTAAACKKVLKLDPIRAKDVIYAAR